MIYHYVTHLVTCCLNMFLVSDRFLSIYFLIVVAFIGLLDKNTVQTDVHVPLDSGTLLLLYMKFYNRVDQRSLFLLTIGRTLVLHLQWVSTVLIVHFIVSLILEVYMDVVWLSQIKLAMEIIFFVQLRKTDFFSRSILALPQ